MNRIVINNKESGPVIAPELHSQFIEVLGGCVNGGIWVGPDSDIPNTDGIRNDFLEAFREIAPPLIRWPGGCYADTYHWRDGIGPREARPVTYNENFATYERDEHGFGTHEFMRLCELVGAKPWLNVNLVSGSVQEMKDWMEYCNRSDSTDLSEERKKNGHPEPFNVEYWGIGNEAWCGGGYYTAQGYADAYRKYACAAPSFRHSLTDDSAVPMKLILSGSDGNKPVERVKWTQEVFQSLGKYRCPPFYGMDLHFYNWNLTNPKETESSFNREDWNRVISGCFELEQVILEQYDLIREGVRQLPRPEGELTCTPPECKLLVGEWGNWHGCSFGARPALFQQVSMRDAVTTALTLDIFHRNADKVSAACVAQTVNVLNSLFLTDGARFIRTPNYDVFKMYMPHRGGRVLQCETGTEGPVHAFASVKDHIITVNLVNADYETTEELVLELPEGTSFRGGEILSSGTPQDCNSWEEPDHIRAKAFTGAVTEGNCCMVCLPAASVTVLRFEQNRSQG